MVWRQSPEEQALRPTRFFIGCFLAAAFWGTVVCYAEEAKPLKIVAFGTSLTSRGGWQLEFQKQLSSCLARPVEIKSIALAGSTSQWGLTQLDRVESEAPDIILIEFYANDAALNRFTSLSTSRANIGSILDQLHARLPQARIVVMAMNPVSGLRGWIRPFIDSYIEGHFEEARRRGLETIDFRGEWARLTQKERDHAISDGLHPRPEDAGKVMALPLANLVAKIGCSSKGTNP